MTRTTAASRAALTAAAAPQMPCSCRAGFAKNSVTPTIPKTQVSATSPAVLRYRRLAP